MNSDTPRTDADSIYCEEFDCYVVFESSAKKLERELNEANAEIVRLIMWLDYISDLSSDATAVGMAENALNGKDVGQNETK